MKAKFKHKVILFIATVFFILHGCRVVYSNRPLPSEQPVLKAFPSNFKGEYKVIGPMDKSDVLAKKYPQNLFDMFWNIEVNKGVCTIKHYFGFQASNIAQISAHRDFKVENDILFYRNDSIKNRMLKLLNKSTKLTENEQYDLEDLLNRDEKGELEQNFPLVKKQGRYTFNTKTAYKIDLLNNDFTDYTWTDKPVEVKVAFKKAGDYLFFNLKESKKDWLPIIVKQNGNHITVSRIDHSNLSDQYSYYSSITEVIKEKDKSNDYVINPSQANLLSFLEEPHFLNTIAILEKKTAPFYTQSWVHYTVIGLIVFVLIAESLRRMVKKFHK